MKILRPIFLCLGLACPALAHASWLATQLSYQAQGWTTGQVYGLNNSGQVVGVMEPQGPRPPGIWEPVPMAFVTGANGSNLHPIDPGYEPYIEYCHGCHTNSTPQAINDAGQIAISNFISYGQELSVTLAGPNGGAIPRPSGSSFLGYGVFLYLNSSGQLGGTYYGPTVGFVTDANGSNPHLLDMLDNNYESSVSGINDHGQLLASGVVAGTTQGKTFVTGPNASGIAFEVGSYGQNSFVSGLNNSLQLVGGYSAIGGETRAFVTGANGAGFTDIGSLGGNTFANALNNNGLIVGDSGGKPFLYGYGGAGLIDLNNLVTLSPGEFLTYAPDINDRGQIVAQSNLGNIYLLSPVPEPSTYLMLLGGLALVCWRTRQPVSRETCL